MSAARGTSVAKDAFLRPKVTAGSCGWRRRVREARGRVHPALAHSLRASITAASHNLRRADHSMRCAAAGVSENHAATPSISCFVLPTPKRSRRTCSSRGVSCRRTASTSSAKVIRHRRLADDRAFDFIEPFPPAVPCWSRYERTMPGPFRCCHTPARLSCINGVANTESTENYARSFTWIFLRLRSPFAAHRCSEVTAMCHAFLYKHA